jgi:hypothetical protein
MKNVSQTVVVFVCTVLVFLLFLSYNLHYFYVHGAAVYDSGWSAWLSRFAADWPMRNPPLIGGFFLPIHFSLIYFIAHVLATLLPSMPYPVWYSLFMALWPALLWIGLFHVVPEEAVRSPIRRAGFVLLLTSNGLSLSTLGFPHVESFIPALFVVCVACWLGWGGKLGQALAIVTFAVLLSVREDAGLHSGLTFAALAVAAVWAKNRMLALRLVFLAAAGLVYSASVLALQKFALPQGGQAMGRVYLGHPFLAHVDGQMLAHRLIYWAGVRCYIFVPLAILAAAASYWRDRTLALGVALCLPWLSLSLVALTPPAGGLFGYYSVPLMFGFFWPLLLARLPGATPSERRIRLVRLQGVMAAVSTFLFVLIGTAVSISGNGNVHQWAPWLQVMPTSPDRIAATERFLSSLSASPQFDRLIFDDGAASLLVGRLREGQYRFALAYSDADISQAIGFVRFIDEDEYVARTEAELMAHFPVCQPVNGTALEQCKR